MDLMVERCAGVDIGKDEVVACVRTPGPDGKGRHKQTRAFPTFTSDLEAMAASRYLAWSKESRTIRAWWSLKRPCRASRSSGIFLRSCALARSARTSGSRSPATSAWSMSRPDTPNTSEATEPSLIPASSRVFWTRWHSEVCSWTSRLR